MATPIETVLGRLRGVRLLSPGKWQALCVAHDDQHHSLSVSKGHDGRVLAWCHRGCKFPEIARALGLEQRDFFPRRPAKVNTNSSKASASARLTVTELAEYFRLNPLSLLGKGVKDCRAGVLIAYFDMDGFPLPRSRLRLALHGADRFKWSGRGRVHPYGLQFIRLWADCYSEPILILVEGESDCWAAWQHGIPALGIPSATQARSLRLEFVAPFRHIYLLREPDGGGDVFVSDVPRRLAQVGWSGEIFELRLDSSKDLAELHRQDLARFDIRFKNALHSSHKISLPKILPRATRVTPRRLRGALRAAARQFLIDCLKDGDEHSSRQIKERASKSGISEATLRRAAVSLPIDMHPCGFGGEWTWQLSATPSASSHSGLLSSDPGCSPILM